MRLARIACFCLLLITVVLDLVSAAPKKPPSSSPVGNSKAAGIEKPVEESPQAVRSPFQRFMLIRQGPRCVALRIIEHPERNIRRARYEWYSQNDGSMNFKKANVGHGTGEVWEREAMPDGSTNTIIKTDSLHLSWSASDWIYFPYISLDALMSMTRTNWTHIQDVNAQSKTLRWVSRGKLVSWGPANAGLKLGIIESSMRENYVGGQVSWHMMVRNVSKKPIELVYYYPPVLAVQAKVTDAKGKQIQVQMPYVSLPVTPTTKLLPPGSAFELCDYALHLKPRFEFSQQGLDSVLDALPGNYSVTLSYSFRDSEKKAWQGTLISGTLPLNILPSPEK